MNPPSKSISEYIALFPPDVQEKLQQMRTTIHKAAPKAEEAIKYAMPTFVFHGNLVHFAGYKNHIGFYPAPAAIEEFKKDLAEYVTSKGAIQFPLDKKLPLRLVTNIVKYRVARTLDKIRQKEKK